MSAGRLVDDIKGTTSLRLFLFLFLGIVLSQFVPPFPAGFRMILVVAMFVGSLLLYLCRQYRASVMFFSLLLVCYGLFCSGTSLGSAELSVLNCQFRVPGFMMSVFRNRGVSEENIPLLSALTLGQRSALLPDTVDAFRASGVAHVLVVSGMHVGFLYLLVSLFVRMIPNRHLSAIAGLSFLWGYAALVGFTLSVCRAVFMFSVLLVMRMVGERYRSFHALFLAAFIQLLITPSALFDVGFQLSYSAVLSILVFYPLLPDIALGIKDSFWKRALLLVYKPVRLTISAQILTAPLVAYYFGQFPLYFVLTNLAVTLLVPVIFIGGFLVLIPYLGTLLAYPLNLMLTLLRNIVSYVASMPMALVQIRISLPVLLLVYLLIVLVVWYANIEEK